MGYLDKHFDAVLAVLNLPVGHRRRFRTANHQERVNQALKRLGRTVRIWPNPDSRNRVYLAPCSWSSTNVGRHHLAEVGDPMNNAPQEVHFGRAPASLR